MSEAGACQDVPIFCFKQFFVRFLTISKGRGVAPETGEAVLASLNCHTVGHLEQASWPLQF